MPLICDPAVMVKPAPLDARILKDLARARGFSLAGVIPVEPTRSHAFYEDWLAAGFAGEMDYLHRHAPLKANPASLCEDARTLLVLAHPYTGYPGSDSPPAREGAQGFRGRISRYALGPDYHDVIRTKLKALAVDLEALAGASLRSRPFVDSAPAMERELAARAGLGWVGRNAMLINGRLGSWFFLAGLLLKLELQPEDYDSPLPEGRYPTRIPSSANPNRKPDLPQPVDLPWRESCGSCTECLDACPTEAIVADKTVDARRCIAYLTIELKGPVPRPLRASMRDWVFGCDICQDVCPWNRHADRGLENASHPGAAPTGSEGIKRFPDLVTLLALDEAAFRTLFRKSVLWRTRRRGLLRNAAIALGNLTHESAGREGAVAEGTRAVGALEGAMRDSEPLVRGAAAWALGRIGRDSARKALRAREGLEGDPEVLEEIRAALAEAGAAG